MRDLMISTRSFSNQQNDFYEHEKKRELEKAKKKEADSKQRVPGM